MEWVETTAKSIEEAKDQALDKLGVDESEAQFEILEEPTKGLFGRTRGEARVRARIEPKAPRSKDDRRDKRGRKRSGRKPAGDGGNRNDNQSRSGATGGTKGGGRTKAATNDLAEAGDKPAAKNRNSNQQSDRPKGEKADGNRGGKRRSGGQKPDRQQKEESSMEDVRDCVDSFLNGLTTAFGIETDVTLDTDDEEIRAQIEGKHGLLLGPKARTLDAIQELTRVTAQRTAPSSIRIKVDVGGYREARREALISFAAKAADKAAAEGVEISLDPMTSADRKIVHDALTDHGAVTTRSAGTDPRRFVVVVPNEPAAAADVDDAGDDDAGDSADD